MQAQSITAEQLRAARGALKLSVRDLAERVGIGSATIVRYEASTGVPKSRKGHLDTLRQFFEASGIEFIGTPNNGPGVRLWKDRRRSAGDPTPGSA
jgi:transcriptional regulator with XRE-family HTH domain